MYCDRIFLERKLSDNYFYVYEHRHPHTNQAFYVGKGSGKRAYDKHTRNPQHLKVINELIASGLTFNVVFISINLSEREAFQIEVQRIAFWNDQGVELINRNKGNINSSKPPDDTQEQKPRRKYKLRIKPDDSDLRVMVKKAIEQAGGVSILARKLDLARQHVHGWKRVPAEWVLRVEKASGISRHELRPDIFGPANSEELV